LILFVVGSNRSSAGINIVENSEEASLLQFFFHLLASSSSSSSSQLTDSKSVSTIKELSDQNMTSFVMEVRYSSFF
jgi:hypothetical protein